jgi:hypothetical protein
MIPDCIYRRGIIDEELVAGYPSPRYNCKTHRAVDVRRCVTCQDFMHPTQVKVPASCEQPVNLLLNDKGQPVNLAGIYRGAGGFLVLGGPSAKSLNLELLSRRGVILFSSNNSSAVLPPHIRPQVTVQSDKPRKFGDWLFLDGGSLSLSPHTMWSKRDKAEVRRKLGPGQFEGRGILVNECPNTLGFARNHDFNPETYLWEQTVNNGNDEQHALGMKRGRKIREPNGFPHCINTMFCALRIPFYMGVRRLYLIGCDFTMTPGAAYSFAQDKHDGGCKSNNETYAKMIFMFEALLPKFKAAGYEVFNCNPESQCYVFPFVKFEDAIERETGDIPQGVLGDYAGEWYDE